MDIGTLTGSLELEDNLSDALLESSRKVREWGSELSKELKDGIGGWEDYAKVVGVAGAAVVAAVAATSAAIVTLGIKGSEIQGVTEAFDHLAQEAGSTGEALRGGLIEGAKGTVDSMELMKSTTKLLSSGIRLTAEDMRLMGATAREMGKATGTDAAHGLQTLSQALMTGQSRLLRSFGIQVDLIQAERDYAKSLGITRGELNQTEKVEAARAAMLEGMRTKLDVLGESQTTFKEKLMQGTQAISNWFDELSLGVATSPSVLKAVDGIGQALLDAFGNTSRSLLDGVLDGINAFAGTVAQYGPDIIKTFGDIAGAIGDIGSVIPEVLGLVKDLIGALLGAAGIKIDPLQAVRDHINMMRAESFLAQEAIKALGRSLSDTFLTPGKRMIEGLLPPDKDQSDLGQIGALNLNLPGGVGTVEGAGAPALVRAARISEEYEKKVRDLLKTLRSGSEDVRAFADAFGSLSSAQLANAGVQVRLIPLIEKQFEATGKISDAMRDEYFAATMAKAAEQARVEGKAKSIGLTLETIAANKNLGQSEVSLAMAVGMTKEQFGTYTAKLLEARKITDEVTKSEEALRTSQQGMVLKLVQFDEAGEQQAARRRFELGTSTAEQLAQAQSDIAERFSQRRLALTIAADRAAEQVELAALARRKERGEFANALEGQFETLRDGIVQQHSNVRTGLEAEEIARTAALRSASDSAIVASKKSLNVALKRLTMTDAEFQISQIEEQTEARISSSKLQGQALQEFSRNARMESAIMTSALKFDATDLKTHSMRSRQEALTYALNTLQIALLNEKDYTEKYIDELKKRVKAAEEAVTGTSIGMKIGRGLQTGLMSAAMDIPRIVSDAIIHHASWEETGAAIASTVGSAIGGAVGKKIGGPLGEAIGTAVGSLAGLLVDVFHRSAGEDVVRRIGRDWGVSITEELGNTIAAQAKSMFGGSRQAAEIFNLDALLNAGGGLTSDNIGVMTGKLHDVFSMMDEGLFTAAQAAHVLDENFGAFAEHFRDGLISRELREIVRLTQEAGIQSKAVQEFLQGQAGRARGGLEGILSHSLRFSQVGGQASDQMVPVSQEQFDRLSRLATTTFSAAIAAGEPFLDVLHDMQGSFNLLNEATDQFGFAQSGAFSDLSAIAAFFDKNQELGKSIQGTNDMLIALANSNLMTQQTFSDLGSIAVENYNAMISGGLTNQQALLAQQDTLQTLWELIQEGTFTVDDQTQALIDQAKEAGLVGEAHMDAQERATAAMEKAAEAMEHVGDVLSQVFGIAGDEAEVFANRTIAAAQRAAEAMGSIQPPTSGIWNWSGEMPTGVVPEAEGGAGTVHEPTLFLAGEAGSEDFSFSGAGRSFSNAGSNRDAEVLDEIRGMRGDLKTVMRGQARTIRDEVLTAPRR